MKKYFYVYNDSQATIDFLFSSLKKHQDIADIKFITKTHILDGSISENLGEIACFFLPGAIRGQGYRDDLDQKGMAIIREATFRGMSLIGICAGGYLLSQTIDYKGQSEAKTISNNIGIFEGVAQGQLPLFPVNSSPRIGWKKAVITPIQYRDQGIKKETLSFYWGGAQYLPAPHEEIEILATYSKLEKSAIAIAAKRYGAGRAVFSGIHPEVSGYDLASMAQRVNDNEDGGIYCQSMADTLIRYQRDQEALFRLILQNAMPDVIWPPHQENPIEVRQRYFTSLGLDPKLKM